VQHLAGHHGRGHPDRLGDPGGPVYGAGDLYGDAQELLKKAEEEACQKTTGFLAEVMCGVLSLAAARRRKTATRRTQLIVFALVSSIYVNSVYANNTHARVCVIFLKIFRKKIIGT
jgi:hypothetical protein